MICLEMRKNKNNDSESALLRQAADICMDIHSKLPEYRLWLWNTWSEPDANNVQPICGHFVLFLVFA